MWRPHVHTCHRAPWSTWSLTTKAQNSKAQGAPPPNSGVSVPAHGLGQVILHQSFLSWDRGEGGPSHCNRCPFHWKEPPALCPQPGEMGMALGHLQKAPKCKSPSLKAERISMNPSKGETQKPGRGPKYLQPEGRIDRIVINIHENPALWKFLTWRWGAGVLRSRCRTQRGVSPIWGSLGAPQ